MEISAANGFMLDQDRLVNLETGEIIEDPLHIVVPPGTRISTPEDRENNRLAMEERMARARYLHRSGERYFFVRRDADFEDISPAMITKLLYLSTFASFNENVLMSSQRTKMKRKDLADILKVSSGSASNFWNAVSPKYVKQDEDGNLILDTTRFKRGRLSRNVYTPYQQMYDVGIRNLYEAVGGRYHKQLGYLFKLLPFVSLEYNLICFNPFEKDLARLQPMSMMEFCAAIGYDLKHVSALLKIYNTVRFNVDGRQERFCTLIYNGLHTTDAIICVNPAIMYSGSNPSRLEITRLYFRD